MIYIQLFLSFLQVGALSFGGGYAAMPLIQEQVVNLHSWLSMSEFTNLITIAEMTPGPIAVNSATFVGMQIAGILGAIIATLGCILPSCIIVTLLAYVPLVVITAGVGRKPQIIVIWIATFLIMTVTIYQGVRNIDNTLVKAARVLGAKDRDIFVKVIFPATTPFILTAVRLGISVALTTLIAAETTGATAGLGMRIRSLANSFETAGMLMYIIIIGIIGLVMEKIIKFLEGRLTGWQEKRE